MNSQNKITCRWPTRSAALLLIGLLFAAGCKGIPTRSERQARNELKAVTRVYDPVERQARLPALDTNATLGTFLNYAMLKQPRVEATYFDYAAAVERITVERSLPDPQLTFESDIADMVMTVMPGFMQMFPGPGKLKAAAGVASAESSGKYFAFESVVLQTAFDVKRTYFNLRFLDERIRINRETLDLLADLDLWKR